MRGRRYTRQERRDLERWFRLRAEAIEAEKIGLAAPVEVSDFRFLLSQGGQLTQEDTPYVDNCYLSRLDVRIPGVRKVYRFKTLTTSMGEFYVSK